MSNYSRCRRPASATPPTQPPAQPIFQEPPVRRWNQAAEAAVPREDATLGYIRCAIAYQNQLLTEIRTLLEQIEHNTEPSSAASEE